MSGGAKEQWERLRQSKKNKEYCIENDRISYEKNCACDRKNQRLAQILTEIFAGGGVNRLVSLGVGKGHLEWHLKDINPKMYICCTDYTEKALFALKKVFITGDSFMPFDMLTDDWGNLSGYDVVLLNRLNSEFDFTQWKRIYAEMAGSGIRRIIFIPSGFGGISDFLNNMPNTFHKEEAAKISWCYTEYEFLKMWKRYYRTVRKISFNDSAIYCLDLKRQ